MNTNDINCEPCLREGLNVKVTVFCYDCSEKLCDDCKRHHKKSKLSSGHKVLELDATTRVTDTRTAGIELVSDMSKCLTHCSEVVKYLCKTHDQLCCNECVITKHRKCEDIVVLDEIVISMGDTADLKKRFEVIQQHAEQLVEHESKHRLELDVAETEVADRLKQFKADIINAVDKMEKRILSETSVAKLRLINKSSEQTHIVKALMDDVKHSIDKMAKILEVGTTTHVFLLDREMEKIANEYDKRVKEIHQNTSNSIFNLVEVESPKTKDIFRIVDGLFELQEVTTHPDVPLLPGRITFKNGEVKLSHEFGIQENSQPRFCLWIDNVIVIAFEFISKITAYRVSDGTPLASYRCPTNPVSMCSLEDGEIAVSLPQSNRIDIIKLDKGRISFVKSFLRLRAELIAFNHIDRQLFVVTKSNRTIRKFSMNGKDAGMIRIDSIGNGILGPTFNISFDSDCKRLYFSSYNCGKLVCIELSGNIEFIYGIHTPWAVVTDRGEHTYVASYGGHEIHQLNKRGKLIRRILTGRENIQNPLGMCLSKQTDRLAVTYYSWNAGVGVKIFEFQ